MKKVINRLSSRTPRWFRTIRNIGIIMGAVGTALLTAPVALPAALVTLGGYLITAGAVAAAVAQTGTYGE